MVEVFAAGNTGDRVIGAANEGYGSINSPGTAKNVTVGASVRPGDSTDAASATAQPAAPATFSTSPAADRRTTCVKPDLVAPGTHVVGAKPQHGDYNGDETCLAAFPTGNPLYSLISGTSQATAAVSGAAALVRDDLSATAALRPRRR